MNVKRYALSALAVLCVGLIPITAVAHKTHYVWITRHESIAANRTSIGYTCMWNGEHGERRRFICKKPKSPLAFNPSIGKMIASQMAQVSPRDSPAFIPTDSMLADTSALVASIEADVTVRNIRVLTKKLPSLRHIKLEAEWAAGGQFAPGTFYGSFVPPVDVWNPLLLRSPDHNKLLSWTSNYPHQTKVIASAGGKVVVAAWFENFGWTIIVSHARGLHTLYTGHHANLVRVNQIVDQSTPIGLLAEKDEFICAGKQVRHYTRWRPIRWYAVRDGVLKYKPLSRKSMRRFASAELKKFMRLQQ